MASKLGFSAITLVLFAAFTELLLAALGLGAGGGEIARGFDPARRYLVPDPDVPGGWRTDHWAGRKPEKAIAPRDERLRVVLFGGSNTEGFPHGVLQDALREESFRRRFRAAGWDVVNLGRSGYGSERIAILFEQALAALSPDVVLLYLGHNEFVEEGFRQDLERAWSPLEARAARAVEELRLFHALAAAFRPAPSPRAPPEAWEWEYGKFADWSLADTAARLERYAENLEGMVREAESAGVAIVLCTLASNDLAAPFTYAGDRSFDPADAARVAELLSAADALLPECARALVPASASERLHATHWGPLGAPPAEPGTTPAARPLSGPLAAREVWWSEPSGWAPLVRPALEAQRAFWRRELAAGEAEHLEECGALLDAAHAILPSHAGVRFRRGLVRWLRGDAQGARAELAEAGDLDRAPRRASRAINAAVRAIAARHPGVRLVDVEELLRSHCPDGILGFELFQDECHLHEAVRHVLMHELCGPIADSAEARAG